VAGGAAIHSDRRLPALTGLRIAAALAVYASHIGAPAGSPAFLQAFFASGYCGVTVFFVLSGFVLAFNYFEDMRQPNLGSAYDFFVARFARVYPLYLLVLLYVVLHEHASGTDVSLWWQHALALQAWDASDAHAYAFNGPGWSIGVEFFLYACFPLLVPLVAKLRTPRALLGAAAIVALAIFALVAWFVVSGKGDLSWLDPASAHRWLYRTPLTRLGDFVLGMLAARAFVQIGGRGAVVRLCRLLAPAAAALIVLEMAWPSLTFSAWSWDVAYAVPGVVLIFALALAPAGWLARGLSLPFIVLLGEASYAFYLVHSPAISLLGAGQWDSGVSGSLIALEALNLGLILAVAVGLHLTVERPARRHIRRLLSRRPRPAPVAA
jgi:peptidoglycan/LPS O-acetylase OafA/YrhL